VVLQLGGLGVGLTTPHRKKTLLQTIYTSRQSTRSKKAPMARNKDFFMGNINQDSNDKRRSN
jgi:hypothetical protein